MVNVTEASQVGWAVPLGLTTFCSVIISKCFFVGLGASGDKSVGGQGTRRGRGFVVFSIAVRS